MNLPDKLFLRRGEVRAYLHLSEGAMTKLIRSGALRPKYLPGMARAHYLRADVKRIQPKNRPTHNGQQHPEEDDSDHDRTSDS